MAELCHSSCDIWLIFRAVNDLLLGKPVEWKWKYLIFYRCLENDRELTESPMSCQMSSVAVYCQLCVFVAYHLF